MSTPARDVVASAHRLMDTMLAAEDECFTRLDSGVQRTADATRERIHHAWRLGPSKLKRAELLPDDAWLAEVLLPPVADLVALARERAVTVADRQMRDLATVVGTESEQAAASGVRVARQSAPDIERIVYTSAADTMTATASYVRGLITEQRRIWAARHEDMPALVARLCSAERVGLPSAGRGVVWEMRTRLHASARAASVDTCNALLMAAMRGWNDYSDEPDPA